MDSLHVESGRCGFGDKFVFCVSGDNGGQRVSFASVAPFVGAGR